jgi:hypothetical protein
MDPVSVKMVRASLIWLAIGFTVGGLMLADNSLPGTWRFWFGPTHGHVLFVGWFFQFAVGVAFWLLPRKRTAELPFGYNERTAFLSFIILNAGLIVRVIAEPGPRVGYLSNGADALLLVSAAAHVLAGGIIVSLLWGRAIQRPDRGARSNTRT